MLKIGVVSQKGGVGKSTICRDLAVQAASNGWAVKVADFDLGQITVTEWNRIRMKRGHTPEIAAEAFPSVAKAISGAGAVDLLIMDGRPASDSDTKKIAEVSDLVVIPTRPLGDDLRPQVRLGQELVKSKIDPAKIVFVINASKDLSSPRVKDARDYIEANGFRVVRQVIPDRGCYGTAQDEGKSISEAAHPLSAQYAATAMAEISQALMERTQ